MKILIKGFILCFSFVAVSATCGGTFTSQSGVITTPNYPNNYPNNQQCTYTFNTGYPINITCLDFVLQPPNNLGSCSFDFMSINDNGAITNYCGNVGPRSRSTSTSTVSIVFRSDPSVTNKGFSCSFASVATSATSTTTTKATTTTTKATTNTTTTTKATATTTTANTTAATTTTAKTTAATTTTAKTTAATTTTAKTTAATTTTAKTTAATTAATTTSVPALLQSTLNLYGSSTCYTTQRSTCGCTTSSNQSKYYTSISGSYRIVAANGIPNHVYETGQQKPNPNKACPHELFMAIPVSPVKGTTYNAYGMGPVGISISGAFFYNHLSDPSGAVAVINEGISFDTCNGHSDQYCRYHYHEVPKCIAGEGNCSFVGYMRDGFPVYTYCTHPTISRYLKSCYSLVSGDGSMASQYSYNQTSYNSGNCDLDQANGYTFPDSRGYAYIFTADYPFIMAGYYGTKLSNLCYLTAS